MQVYKYRFWAQSLCIELLSLLNLERYFKIFCALLTGANEIFILATVFIRCTVFKEGINSN